MTRSTLFVTATALVLGAPAFAATQSYRADVTELNGTGASGTVDFLYDTVSRELAISGAISGLAPNQVHVQHIHGRFADDGTPRDSVTPPPSADTDGDGIISVAEGAPFYGDILLPLEDQSDGVNNGPVSDADGDLVFDYSFDLDDDSSFFNPLSGTEYSGDDLLPLSFREYVVHGVTLENGEYSVTTPAGAGEISAVPLPAGGLLLLGGLGALGLARRRKG